MGGIYLVVVLGFYICFSAGATVRWTNAGGNPLWEEPRNWDLGRVPSVGDDVIIDIQNIPGNVRIAAVPANVGTLTVGGTSGTPQTLTVQGSLTISSGSIQSNGNVILQSANENPFTSYGTFNAADKMLFLSGSLSGPGKFVFTNITFSGPAEKQINSSVYTVDLSIQPGNGATGVVNIASGILSVSGTLETSQSLILSSSVGAQLNVPGTFTFDAESSAYTATIRGLADINVLNAVSGTIILNDNVNIGSANVGQAAISLIGATSSTRVFGDITGQGVLQIQGGTNQFTTISNLGSIALSGGSLALTTKGAVVTSLSQTGGSITGPATLQVQNMLLINAQILSIPISVSTLTLQGFTSLTGSSILVTSNAVISSASQISFSSSSSFVISSNALVSQSAPFKLLPAGTGSSSLFTLNGKWSSSSDLQIVVPTSGTGTFQLSTGSTTTVTGINFAVGSLVLSSATFTSVGSEVSVATISGNGVINNQGNQFTVTQSLNVAQYTQTSGTTHVSSGGITTLDIQEGDFYVTGPAPPVGPYLTIGSFTFEGGSLYGSSITCSVSASTIAITGTQPHTFEDVTVNAPKLTASCGSQQCQIFTQNAQLNIGQ